MIHPILEPYNGKINELCRHYSVSKLYVFGSVTSDEFDEVRSDVDFLVELPDELAPEMKGDTYFQLLSELETLLNRRIDLVLGQSFRNPYFARAVEKSKKLIYAA
ncbi:nucleotidyltransferase family protein [Spirosoma aerophilum]